MLTMSHQCLPKPTCLPEPDPKCPMTLARVLTGPVSLTIDTPINQNVLINYPYTFQVIVQEVEDMICTTMATTCEVLPKKLKYDLARLSIKSICVFKFTHDYLFVYIVCAKLNQIPKISLSYKTHTAATRSKNTLNER